MPCRQALNLVEVPFLRKSAVTVAQAEPALFAARTLGAPERQQGPEAPTFVEANGSGRSCGDGLVAFYETGAAAGAAAG